MTPASHNVNASTRRRRRAHARTREGEDVEVAVTYFSGFQQDLSLLLVLPLLLHSLQLLEEAKLRASVCRLLVALIILARGRKQNHCSSLQRCTFHARIFATDLRTGVALAVYLDMLGQ